MDISENEDVQLIEKDFERISKAIKLLWETEMLCDYIDRMLNDTRDGKRMGFPKPVFEALLRLRALHLRLFPQYDKKTDSTQEQFRYF